MSISEGDVRHVAALARLGLDEARIPSLVAELNGILAHMEVLQGVTLPEAREPAVAERDIWLRADVAGSVSLEGGLSAFAPELSQGFFLVPRLATHGASGAQAGAPGSATAADAEDES